MQRGLTSQMEAPPVPDRMTDLAQQTGTNDSAKEVAERDARWIGDFAGQLTMSIAPRKWDAAADLAEQGISFSPLNTCRLPPF
jgi:hypothetical protein